MLLARAAAQRSLLLFCMAVNLMFEELSKQHALVAKIGDCLKSEMNLTYRDPQPRRRTTLATGLPACTRSWFSGWSCKNNQHLLHQGRVPQTTLELESRVYQNMMQHLQGLLSSYEVWLVCLPGVCGTSLQITHSPVLLYA